METETGTGSSRQWKRKDCSHCCENVSKSTYYSTEPAWYSHRAWYKETLYRLALALYQSESFLEPGICYNTTLAQWMTIYIWDWDSLQGADADLNSQTSVSDNDNAMVLKQLARSINGMVFHSNMHNKGLKYLQDEPCQK